jgi:hypothetical protein
MNVYSSAIQLLPKTDVLVIGSGSAGATAAIAAAQEGIAVTLVERYGFMGGTSTAALDTFCGFYVHTADGQGRKVVGGIPDQVIKELTARRKAIIRSSTYWQAGKVITYCPHTLKVIWEQLAQEAGVRLLYHTLVIDGIKRDGRVAGVIAATKGGLIRLEADLVIDASGDADVAFYAGVPCETPQDQPVQALTTTFRLANVDVERAMQTSESTLHTMMAQATASGDYDLPRAGGDIFRTPLPGVIATNITRMSGIDPTDPVQLTQAEIEGRQQAMEYARFFCEQIPGYEHAYLAGLATQIGVRESRRIFGEYRLTREDVLEARRFEDAIAQCGWPFESHSVGHAAQVQYLAEGQTYDIPFRCLIPQQVEGLLVVGRCLSADHDAHASVRVMAQCMAMGQAAGVAAAIATDRSIGVREVPIAQLQTRLRDIGAVI